MGTPQLNIKDAEATRLVRELTELTGETQTEAVREALRQRLAREKAERSANAAHKTERQKREFEKAWGEIQKIQAEIRQSGFADDTVSDHDLYDENGLPK